MPITRAPAGQPLTVTVEARSPAGVKWARLRYRAVNQYLDYETLYLLPTGKADEYQCVVPAEALSRRWDFMYYVEVMDNHGQGRIFPDLEERAPYVVVRLQR